MLFGIHASVSKGYNAAVDYVVGVGGECMQIFAKSPRQWVGPPVDGEAAKAFSALRRATGFGPVFTHTAYLLNLSSVDEELRVRSAIALADEIVRCGVLRADGVVTHVGTDTARDLSAAAARTAESIHEAFRVAGAAGAGVRLLLENTAGAGASFGAALAELDACISATAMPAEKVGVCIDTCHAFAYGYELDTPDGCHEFVGELDSSFGLERLGLMHLNDCMFARSSKRDRHAWIGDGLIGSEGFRALVNDGRLAMVPAVTEMSGEVPVKDRVNIERLRLLAGCREMARRDT